MTPRHAGYEQAVRDSFARQGAMAHLGTRLARVAPGLCVLEQPFGPPVAQQQGLFHGGMIAAVADVAGGYAALSMAEAGREALTVEYKISFLAPARGALLVATGRVLRAGRTLVTTAVDVTVDDTLVATALQTIMPVVPFAERPRP